MLNITNDAQVDERLVSIIYPDETFESFCVRYIVETIHDMDHMNF